MQSQLAQLVRALETHFGHDIKKFPKINIKYIYIYKKRAEMLLLNSYRTEFMCYGYGVGLFLLFYVGKLRWLLVSALVFFVLYSLYLTFYILHVRGAVQEIRYSTEDFTKRIDQFLVEHLPPSSQHEGSGSDNANANDSAYGDCVICMEDFSIKGRPHTLHCPCKENYYHKGCIREWLLKSATCPICRTDLKFKAVVWV